MSPLSALRSCRLLLRLALAWFVLSIGVAAASPLVRPQAIELVCSGGAFKLLIKTDEGVKSASSHTLDCPLCIVGGAPPPHPAVARSAHAPQAGDAPTPHATHHRAPTAAPLLARAPPPRAARDLAG